jgi:hypothetical protein
LSAAEISRTAFAPKPVDGDGAPRAGRRLDLSGMRDLL